MNGEVEIGDTILRTSDTSDEMAGGNVIQNNNFSLSFSSGDSEGVRKAWDGFVEAGAEIIMPREETCWASQFGIV